MKENSRATVTDVFNVIAGLYEGMHGQPPLWTKDVLKRQLARGAGKSSWDLAGIETHIARVIQNQLGLHGKVHKPAGVVTGMCAATSGGKELVSAAVRASGVGAPVRGIVVQADATHGVVDTGYKLVVFVMTNENGETCIIFYGYVKKEDQGTYDWVFLEFKDWLGDVKLYALITDGDPCFPVALERAWGIGVVTHLRCVFHVWKNFYGHCSWIRGDLGDECWREKARRFWVLARYMFIIHPRVD